MAAKQSSESIDRAGSPPQRQGAAMKPQKCRPPLLHPRLKLLTWCRSRHPSHPSASTWATDPKHNLSPPSPLAGCPGQWATPAAWARRGQPHRWAAHPRPSLLGPPPAASECSVGEQHNAGMTGSITDRMPCRTPTSPAPLAIGFKAAADSAHILPHADKGAGHPQRFQCVQQRRILALQQRAHVLQCSMQARGRPSLAQATRQAVGNRCSCCFMVPLPRGCTSRLHAASPQPHLAVAIANVQQGLGVRVLARTGADAHCIQWTSEGMHAHLRLAARTHMHEPGRQILSFRR